MKKSELKKLIEEVIQESFKNESLGNTFNTLERIYDLNKYLNNKFYRFSLEDLYGCF